MDNQYIWNLNVQRKSVGKRLYAVVCLMLVASLLLTTTSFAWLTLSQAPEVTGMSSNIGANGNLEIALGKDIGESAAGDSFDKNEVTQANRTWGNLIDLTDESYGLQEITLRPVILNSAGGAMNTLHPFAHPVYDADGRIEKIYANDMFAGTYNEGAFVTGVNEYGVRAIGTTAYIAPGLEDTFGPLSQRQEIFYNAQNNLWTMTSSSYASLCENSQSVLMAYCTEGTGVSASDFDLNTFSQRVAAVVSAANEELRLVFTLLAASETTSADNYFMAMKLLEQENPDYEMIRSLVSAAIQAEEAESAGTAIAELRTFQDVLKQLQTVIASGVVNSSDGYSMEEIAQTVGLIFDLEKTGFSKTSKDYWSKLFPNLHYRKYLDGKYWWTDLDGLAMDELTNSVHYSNGQDNDSREAVAYEIAHTQTYSLYRSLPLEKLDPAIADLYSSHWIYWDNCAEEYQLLQDETADLESQVRELEDSGASEAAILLKATELSDKKAQLQSLIDGEIYAFDDERLVTIQTIMTDTIEVLRQYTLWSIAYCACDGQVPDDAYHRILEIASSTENIHPRTVYQTLCNYGVKPQDELTNMVVSFEKLEKELLFLRSASSGTDTVTWNELSEELRRIFGITEHRFYFSGHNISDSTSDSYVSYGSSYFPEDTSTPMDVMTKLKEELDAYENAVADFKYKSTKYHITYKYVDEENKQPWAQALGLLCTFDTDRYPFEYGTAEYTLADQLFSTEHSMWYAQGFQLSISVGVGSEDNFNESGLTVRQTRFQKAQENISYYQNQLITAAVNPDKDMVTLLMQMIAGQSEVSLSTISDYLLSLQQQLEYAEKMMYHAALAMAASDYAEDAVYQNVYSGSGSQNAARMIELLRQSDFDEKVLIAFAHRMDRIDNQKALLKRSETLMKNYQDPKTGALTTEWISATEAAELLNPVLNTDSLTLYGYIAEQQGQNGGSDTTDLIPKYVRTVLYTGYGSPSVQIDGNQAAVGNSDPVTLFGEVYLSLGHSVSGSLLALAKPQVENYTPPVGSVDAGDIANLESGINRKAYAVVTGGEMFTLNLCTMDTSYVLATNLWDYTGNTEYISANNVLVDVYGYCIDLSFRTNAVGSDLLLQTEATNRIDNGNEALAYTSMGAGSYMEFSINYPSYTMESAKEYMSCLRVAITDTRTGYIYGYAVLEMDAAEVVGVTIKAPLRLCDKDTGIMLEGDSAQYICHLDQNIEKNISVYVYLDGAKTSNSIVSAYDEQSLHGKLNLQFCSSANLIPAQIDVGEN